MKSPTVFVFGPCFPSLFSSLLSPPPLVCCTSSMTQFLIHDIGDVIRGKVGLVIGRLSDGSNYKYCVVTSTKDKSQNFLSFDSCVQAKFSHGSVVEVLAGHPVGITSAHLPNYLNLNPPKPIEQVISLKSAKIGHSGIPADKQVGQRSLLLLVMNYQDRSSPCNAACALSKMYGASGTTQSMYLENSYGSLTFVSTPTPSRPLVRFCPPKKNNFT